MRYLAFAGLLLISKRYDVSLYPAYALLYAIGCLRVTSIPVRWLEFAPLRYLGKISYGIYSYHMLVIFLWGIYFVPHRNEQYFGTYLVPFSILGITLLLAHLSYFYFEKRFLDIKHKFSTIPSAN